MYISDKLVSFLNDSRLLSNSTIILTDLEKVVFVVSNKDTEYLNKELSNSLKQILSLYKNDITSVDYMNTTMDSIIPITDYDTIKYQSQIILPIIHNQVIDGLLIFIADDRKYLSSSLKYAKTTQHFVEVFTEKENF